MQKAYLMALYDLAARDKRVLSLLADSGTGYDELFMREFPDQMIDFGIAEEHMVGAAAGMACCGKIPFVYTAGAFLAYRSYEFVRNDICLQNLNVKITGMGSGLAWSTLGPTHHTTEDISVLRALPNLTVFSPACPRDVEKAVKAAYEIEGPVYIRIGMNAEPDIYGGDFEFVPGRNVQIRKGGKLALFSTGSITSEALKAAELLQEQGIAVSVYHVHTMKPFDEESVVEAAKTHSLLVTVEEHNIYGGLGSIVSEVVAEKELGVGVKRIGLPDRFAKGYGTLAEVRRQNGLDAESIREKLARCLADLTGELKHAAEVYSAGKE